MGLRRWLGLSRPQEITVAFIGLPSARAGNLSPTWNEGKVTFDYFFPPFARTLAAYSFDVQAFWHSDFCAEPRRGNIAILVYSEGKAHKHKDLVSHIQTTRAFAERSGFRIIHPLETGQILIDKTRTNHVLTSACIPMPKLILEQRAPSLVFSNANSSSKQPVFLYEPGALLDPARYNTEFIDTTFRYAGRDYYISLRAMCVGGTCYSIFPRARFMGDESLSVHAKDTPLDAGLLNAIHMEIIVPRKNLILDICERLGQALGLGFYSHDILPAAGSIALFVCETCFKFDDPAIRGRLAPLRGQLMVDDYLTDEAPVKAAHAFAAELGRAPSSSSRSTTLDGV